MSDVPFPQIRRVRACRRRGPLDPRAVLGAVLVLSLVALVALPRVAEALSEAMPPPSDALGVRGAAGCRVVEVVDGDTVTLACPGRPAERARLTGFDTPELFSPKCQGERILAMRAKRHLARVLGRVDHLGVVRKGHDRYGRVLVAMSVDGEPVAREMTEAGLARLYDGGRRAGWCRMEPARPAARGSAKWVGFGGEASSEHGTGAKWLRIGS